LYTQRIIHIPALGKGVELLEALKARNAAGNAAAPHALSVSMFSPEPAFIHSIRFKDLAAIEAYQEQQLANPAFREQTGSITACLARPQAVLLYEELTGTEVAGSPKFLIRNRICPDPAKGPELRSVIEERLMRPHAAGLMGARLSRQVASIDGPAFVVTLLFASLGGVDQFRAANEADGSFGAYVAKVASLTRAPLQQRVNRIIVPFGS
jgi:hypothetical protein